MCVVDWFVFVLETQIFAILTTKLSLKNGNSSSISFYLLTRRICKFSSYLKTNMLLYHYKNRLVSAIQGSDCFYCENYTKPINTFCRPNAELFNVSASGTVVF